MPPSTAIMNMNRFIKNVKQPICKHCHFYNSISTKLGYCTKFGEKNIITGVITYKYAADIRYDDNLCGMNGVYFMEKIPNHVKQDTEMTE